MFVCRSLSPYISALCFASVLYKGHQIEAEQLELSSTCFLHFHYTCSSQASKSHRSWPLLRAMPVSNTHRSHGDAHDIHRGTHLDAESQITEKRSSLKNKHLLKMCSSSGHPRWRWVCFFIRFVEMCPCISVSAMDALQWMGAVRMRVQTADKNITIIHK